MKSHRRDPTVPDHQQTVLVTGASGGVGRAIVERLDGLGWRVFAGVRSAEAGARLAHGRRCVVPVVFDLRDEATIQAARDSIRAATGLQALVNNAGLSVDGPLELVPTDRLRQQFEVNVVGQIAVTQAFLPMLRAGHGRIVNIGGAAGRLTLPMYGALSASKAAFESISNALRMELAHQGVFVSHIDPGALDTQLFTKSAQTVAAKGLAGSPTDQARYRKALTSAATAMAKQKPEPVGRAVDVVVKALTARRPKPRYTVGTQAGFVMPVLRCLPVGVRDRLVLSNLNLTADSFT